MITRFSPSPTGFLHIGGARTALFNWLAAKKYNGKFLLRIEDTDKNRSTLESVHQILTDMKWLGLDWDEGPDIEGPNSPYFQSQRNDIYLKYADELIKSGNAYRCFCSEEEIEFEKQKQTEKPFGYKYSKKCLSLSENEIKTNLNNGIKYSVRFNVPENQDIRINDMVKGNVVINTNEIGDFILIKSDGGAVYNFAVVVDDALMHITHILRGDDHLSNTPKQILLYKALGFTPPVFGHLSMIHGEDGKKLSKRTCAVAVGQYKDEGFLNTAVVNYLAMLGWAFPQNKEVLSIDELIKEFNIDKFSKSAAVFNIDKLKWINSQHLKKLNSDELFDAGKPFIDNKYLNTFDEDLLKKMLVSIRDYLNTLSEINDHLKVYDDTEFNIENEAKAIIKNFDINSLINIFLTEIDKFDDLTGKKLYEFVKIIQKESGIKGKDFYKVLRILITGKTKGLELNYLLELIPINSLKFRAESFIT